MIPEEDQGPRWLRGYGDIEADISRMDEFAANLRNDLIKNYIPHLQLISDDVSVELPPVDVQFQELLAFLVNHRESLVNTSDLVHFYQNETNRFAIAAKKISENYATSDAFSAAQVKDVEAALNLKGFRDPDGPTTTPTGTT
ncbi:hypothetical protein GCM10027280_12400 [Micromonospora polyrhachis]|uniref:Uncharacterized protein n=1 Tax=Micromonospora polyrhachis TaxID=1282883 RepID=A0A7W7WQF7_9ACTN|nr:hypothetical protein [Micromonospora polyrhachis]MBB4959975.1 hypothetical protein [Micromonospora polyrhachis]